MAVALTSEKIKDVVESTILQAAEISGLTNWLIREVNKNPDARSNEETIVQFFGENLVEAFQSIPDPDDPDYDSWAEQYFGNRP